MTATVDCVSVSDITTYIGCFSNDKRTSGFVKTINHSTIISKTDDCIKECRKQGKFCLCWGFTAQLTTRSCRAGP